MNDVIKNILTRRSVRSYKPEQIKKEELDLILEAALYAPSAMNGQPWHFTVIQSRDEIMRLNEVAKTVMLKSDDERMRKNAENPNMDFTYGAPTLIVVSGSKTNRFAVTDCSAAIQNMLLAASSLDIGSVWLGIIPVCFMVEGEAEKVGIPEGYEAFYGVALGYKASDKEQAAPARKEGTINFVG